MGLLFKLDNGKGVQRTEGSFAIYLPIFKATLSYSNEAGSNFPCNYRPNRPWSRDEKNILPLPVSIARLQDSSDGGALAGQRNVSAF